MSRIWVIGLLAPVLLGGCQTVTPEPTPPVAQTCRFLLTFDDGPSTSRNYNPTLEILKKLDSNDVQPGIKALFFVQTRSPTGGGSKFGREIMRYQHAQGHVLALHSGTVRGHIRHTKMAPGELAQSLEDGQADLRAITGQDAAFVRPTFWGYSDLTRSIYADHHFKMLLTDVNNRDGIFIHNMYGRRERVRLDLLRARSAIERGELPALHGSIPLIVTLHDVNTFTALQMTGYLRMLVEEARAVGLPLAGKPFYDNATDIIEAASLRAIPPRPVTVTAQNQPADASSPSKRVATVQPVRNTAIPVGAALGLSRPNPVLP